MKWIKLSEGHYGLVEDDDPRPEDKKFASRKPSVGVPHINNRPPWAISANIDKLANDADFNQSYTDHVQNEKKKWASDGKWKNWEKGRKDYVKKQKSEWIKKGARPQDRDAIMNG